MPGGRENAAFLFVLIQKDQGREDTYSAGLPGLWFNCDGR